ncbi:MAG: host-nuclease inhibitor Gam family protein [Desulfarculales bacterium]|jgi:phage host-nuclease inhibitor protein Gam|nr:host-nuclease inhibitor Gam family protein [Desulfarculales bacterium]
MRHKPLNTPVVINNLAEAEDALSIVAGYERAIDEATGRMNAGIDQLKAETAESIKPIQEQISSYSKALALFAANNRKELWGGKKTLELNFGFVGWRKSTSLKTKARTTWAMVLERLKEYAFNEAIRVREEPDKDIMREWPDERLELVGVIRQETDTFFIETKKEELKEN